MHFEPSAFRCGLADVDFQFGHTSLSQCFCVGDELLIISFLRWLSHSPIESVGNGTMPDRCVVALMLVDGNLSSEKHQTIEEC